MKYVFLIALALPGALLAGDSKPGAPIVAADEAYAKAMQDKGTWTATRAFAAPQGELLFEKRVNILEYGKNAPDPTYRITGKTEHVWISCDGTVGVAFSSWDVDKGKARGWRETVWAKMKNGSWRILLTNGGDQKRKLFSQPGRKGMRAVCGGKPPPLPLVAPDVDTDFKLGASHDQTLIWSSSIKKGGDTRVVISLWDGTKHVPVLEDVAPTL